MGLNRNELKQLMLAVAKADRNAPTAYSFGEKNYSYEDLNETLRLELKELAGTYSLYRENKNTIFALIEEVVDEILPKKVLDQYGMFAEVRTFAQGDRPLFNKKEGKRRAKQFITRVGLAGIYEVFKLDRSVFEVPTSAYGGAAQIGFEEFLDGKVDFAEVTQIIMEGLDEIVYAEIAKALVAGIGQLPTANQISYAGFAESEMDKLLAVSRAYGDPTIYCTYEFAAKMLPDKDWASSAMKDELRAQGYISIYKGAKVIIMPQSFEDETNAVKVIDPSYAWVIPTGGNDKPVKIAFEGQTIVDEYTNYDRSREIQVYKKLGVVAIMTNNICVYEDTSL
ncbi:MAG: hypothetical protein HUJ68_11925 [Clostridia bacterium]|nr:hypothetical protein [Clostridia bacterium]